MFSREERPELLSGAREWTQNLRDRVGSLGQNMFAGVVSRISGAINNVVSGIQRAVSSLVSGIGMAVSGVMSGIGGLFVPSGGCDFWLVVVPGFGFDIGAWGRGIAYSFGVFGIFLGISTRGWHSSVAEAARAFRDFLVANRPTRSIREYSGIIYARNIGSGYTFSGPLQGVATCSLAVPIPPLARAGIHSHPSGSERFTDPDDIDWATTRGMPMFLVTGSGRLLMVTPQRVISIVFCPAPNCIAGARCATCRANPPFAPAN